MRRGWKKRVGDVTAVSDLGYVAVTTGVGEVGTGISAVDVTVMSSVGEERTEIFAGDVMAVRDVGQVAVTTGVSEMGTRTSTGNLTVMSGGSEEKTGKKGSW